jgi:L-ribulose-5-phosphate 3-epimerase
MSSFLSRRQFIGTLGAGAVTGLFPNAALNRYRRQPNQTPMVSSAFKVAVITDEISQDFEHALKIASEEFGLGFVELRGMWGKNLMKLDSGEIDKARRLLERYRLQVSSIASPIYKVDWPGAPISKYSPRDKFGADFTFEQQPELIEHALEMVQAFNTTNLRIFDYWRLENPAPYRAAMDEKLIEAATKASRRAVTVLLENEHECNTATAAESVRTLNAVRLPNFKLNWDPGNAAARGDIPYPNGYSLLPKERIGYMHCKDLVRKQDGKTEWMAMGRGAIDYLGMFRALRKGGYRGVVSLETHWRGAGTPEESTRQSWAGMKDLLQRSDKD